MRIAVGKGRNRAKQFPDPKLAVVFGEMREGVVDEMRGEQPKPDLFALPGYKHKVAPTLLHTESVAPSIPFL